jgi:hypothetical protein
LVEPKLASAFEMFVSEIRSVVVGVGIKIDLALSVELGSAYVLRLCSIIKKCLG